MLLHNMNWVVKRYFRSNLKLSYSNYCEGKCYHEKQWHIKHFDISILHILVLYHWLNKNILKKCFYFRFSLSKHMCHNLVAELCCHVFFRIKGVRTFLVRGKVARIVLVLAKSVDCMMSTCLVLHLHLIYTALHPHTGQETAKTCKKHEN